MDRRTFVGSTLAAATSSFLVGPVHAQPIPKAKNVVLVHGLFADGSSWSEVIPRLQAAGLNVTSVQNPLTTLPEAVDSAVRRRSSTQSDRSANWCEAKKKRHGATS
jgi:hypothetical protein